PVTSEINWTNKLNEYKNVFALSTEEFKKFAITQNEKVSGKDKKIAQLLKTDANIEEVTKEVLIKQKCGYQDYETEQTRAQSMSSQNKQCKIDEKDKEYSANDISINMHERIVTTKQEEKLKEDQDLETTKSITHKKKGKAKQVSASVIQEKENCKILAVMSQILTRLNKLEERQENKKRN
ncbi:9253_t:CDS:2, partial [Gigaspora margarita]